MDRHTPAIMGTVTGTTGRRHAVTRGMGTADRGVPAPMEAEERGRTGDTGISIVRTPQNGKLQL